MSNPLFPDVPIAIGVPPVLRNVAAAAGSIINSAENVAIGAAQSAISGAISNVQSLLPGGIGGASGLVNGAFGSLPTALTGDSADAESAAAAGGQWGIFNQDGTFALEPDSIKTFDYKHDWKLPNYPMEKGAFQSYNKVQLPFETRLVMTKGGTEQDRNQFLTAVENTANSVTLYNVVTPDITYNNVSIASYNLKRTSTNGVTMLTVEIAFEEIRLAPAAQFTDTASPNGADQTNDGAVQSTPLTTGSDVTADSLTSAVAGGSSLASAISAGTSSALGGITGGITGGLTSSIGSSLGSLTSGLSGGLGSLSSSAASSILSTVTPAVTSAINSAILSISPVSPSIAAQASNLLRIM